MQWSVFVLILMGQCSFLTCQLYEYHFIKEEMTWVRAQEYCKAHYTDLAIVYDMEDMERLKIEFPENENEAWIGLNNRKTGKENRTWHWSLPGVEYYEEEDQWGEDEPNDSGSTPPVHENCVCIKDRKWRDHKCDQPFASICYDDKSTESYHLIPEEKTWLEAQAYCRDKHTDLISGGSQVNESLNELNKTNKLEQEKLYWIGMFRDTWRWSGRTTSSFRNWDFDMKHNKRCATVKKDSGKWDVDGCNKSKPFFCYEDKTILIQQNVTWEEALYYCREDYDDLVSITSRAQQKYVQEVAKAASSRHVWLGLRYTCTLGFWFWVRGETVSYENWYGRGGDGCDKSGAMKSQGKHKWVKKDDNKTFNFICSTC